MMKRNSTKTNFSRLFRLALFIGIFFFPIQTITYGQSSEYLNSNKGFIKEAGQFKTFDKLKFQYEFKNTYVYFLTDKVVFITKGIKYKDSEASLEASSKGEINLAKKLSAITEVNRFDLLFLNSNQNVEVYGEELKKLQLDFYLGHCPDGILNVQAFNKIRYKNIYPNVDLIFYQDGDLLKYEFIVYPNGDPSLIRLQWEGVDDLLINKENEIQFSVASFNFIDKAPVSFCGDKEIETNYSLNNNRVEFNLANYNNLDTLIIDPALYWASSLEYNGYGTWGELVANSNGEYYFVDWEWNPGNADVANYLASAGTSTLYSSDMTNNDIIISRFNTTGNLTWACRYGGTGDDDVNGAVTLDDNDNLYIAGTAKKEFSSASGDFPLQTLTGAFNQAWDGSLSAGTRGYLLKFLPDNSRQWATYLDRGANLEVFDIECGINNNIYLTGKSGGSPTYIQAGSIPSGSGYLGALNGTSTAHSFILQFNSSGALYWATWLPGATASTSTGRCSDITVDKSTGYVYLAGDEMWSSSTRFSTTLITDTYTNLGQNDMFYMGFNASNQPVPSYGKYVGGAGFDKINIGAANGDIELDSNGNLYVCGHTYSANFPTVDPGGCTYYDGTINDGSGITANVASTQDGYLYKVNTSGTIIYSTFFGGTAYTSMKKLKKDSHDNLWICGQQTPAGLATVNHNDYYNQTIAGTSTNIMFSQLKDDDRMEWLSYYGFTTGYSGYSGFDIWEPTSDSMYLYLAGKFNVISNTGGGYQYTASSTCTGAAQFRHYLSSSAPFTISGTSPICQGSSATWTSSSTGGTWSSSNTSVATVNSSTGVVTGVSAGTADITYTINISGCDYDVTETVTIIETPVAPSSVSASQTSICNSGSSVLSYSGGSGTTFNWYTGSCGGTLIGTGNNLTVNPVTTTTYYGAWESSCGTSSCESVTITVTSNPTGPSNVSASPTLICNGSSTTLSYTGGSGSTFNWYTGSCGGTLAGTGNNLSVSPATTTTYYGAWENSCGTSSCQSVTITVNTNPTPSITGALSFCTGNSTTLDAGGGYTSYNWTGGGTNQTNIVTVGGSYTVTVTDANGCTGTDNVTVTENANLTPTITGTLSFCSGSSTVLDAGGGYTSYDWTGGGINQTNTVTVGGSYTVTVSDANGCTGTDNVTVTENSNPTPGITGALSFCTGNSTTLDAGAGYNNYIWSPSGNSQTINVTAGGNYSVTVTDANGCTGSDNVTVIENTNLTPTITGTLDFCTGSSTTLDAGGGYNTYIWSPSGNSQTLVVTTSGNYSVTVSDINGCTGSDDVTVVENSNPTPTITGNLSFCTDNNTTLNAGSSYITYLWSTSDVTQTILVTTGGNYSVTVSDANGCTGTDNVTVTENQISITNNNISICNGDSVLIYNTWQSTAGVYYDSLLTTEGCDSIMITNLTLTTGIDATINPVGSICENAPYIFLSATTPGGVYSGQGITDPNNGIFNPAIAGTGSHDIIYTISGACGNSDTITIVVDSIPDAVITGDNEIMFGGTAVLMASDGDSYLWSPNDDISCINCQNIEVSPSVTSRYCVNISYNNGCIDSACVTIYVDTDCGELFIPNAFSPNGDGYNDVLYVRGECFADMYLAVYDRWGELIFESKDQNNGWDGTYKGKQLDDAVFMYYLKVTFTNKKEEVLKGNISLIR